MKLASASVCWPSWLLLAAAAAAAADVE